MGYGLYLFQLKVNVATLLDYPIKCVIALATWGCLWLAVVIWHLRIHDVLLRRTLWTVPVFIAGMLVAGFVIELRIYGFVVFFWRRHLPLMAPHFLSSLGSWWGRRSTASKGMLLGM